MKLFMTSGSMDFMKSLRKKYANDNMVVMDGKGNSLIIHETNGDTVFQSPISYNIIASYGELIEDGFFALHHIPISDEGRPIFEHWMLSRIDVVEDEPGFLAHRVLRPESLNTYIVLTQWTDSRFFKIWKESMSYKKIIKESEVGAGQERKPHMFSSAPYITTYKVHEED